MTTNETLTPEQAGAMLEAADAANTNPIRQIAEQMFRSGEITESSTFADVDAALERRYQQ